MDANLRRAKNHGSLRSMGLLKRFLNWLCFEIFYTYLICFVGFRRRILQSTYKSWRQIWHHCTNPWLPQPLTIRYLYIHICWWSDIFICCVYRSTTERTDTIVGWAWERRDHSLVSPAAWTFVHIVISIATTCQTDPPLWVSISLLLCDKYFEFCTMWAIQKFKDFMDQSKTLVSHLLEVSCVNISNLFI